MTKKRNQFPVLSLPKFVSGVPLIATFLLASLAGSATAFTTHAETPGEDAELSELGISSDLLAQATQNSILYFYTPNHVVNVFRQDDITFMNVYDSTNNVTRLSQASAQYTILNGQPTYISTGSYSGNQARFIVSIPGNRQARLIIRSGTGETFVDESASRFDVFETPPEQGASTDRDTILRFDTDIYAVRVFERNGVKLMNVFNRLTNNTEVNGAAANLVPAEGEFRNAVSYVASGTNTARPLEYYARVNRTGGILEIFNVNGQLVAQDSSNGPVVVNIPAGDLPEGFEGVASVNNAWVAAVFGDERTLQEVQRFYPEAFFDSARQGRFINVGAFSDRGDALDVVDDLQDRDFNARVLFRDVDFR